MEDFPRKYFGKEIVLITIIYALWITAWLIEQRLEAGLIIVTESSKFFYWLFMKILIWIVPGIYLIRISKSKIVLLPSKNLKQNLILGIGAGLILGLFALTVKFLRHQPLLSPSFTFAFLSGVITSPVLEEFLFRGAIQTTLKNHFSFIKANGITSILFLGMHLPGWYFQGKLLSNIPQAIERSCLIFIIGLVLGYVANKSGSILSSILTHIINNFFNI